MRHTFAVHRIAQWYAEGADVQSRLPALATYMGHSSIESTQYYATVTAEILEHAGRRFECACAPHEER
jgi:site-specific recombinase XerD